MRNSEFQFPKPINRIFVYNIMLNPIGTAIGSLIIVGTLAACPGILMAGVMSSDSGDTTYVGPILCIIPIGIGIGTLTVVCSNIL